LNARRGGPASEPVKTNVDLFAAAGCAGMAKIAAVDVYCVSNPLPGFMDVVSRLQAAAAAAARKWGGVRRLEVAIHTNLATRAHDDEVAGDGHELRHVADMLAAAMPRVRHLSLGGMGGSAAAALLYGRVAGVYASQLQSIQCRCPISVAPGCRFTRLKDVHASYGLAGDWQLPQMNPAELTTLTLHGWTSTHWWASFGAGNGAGEIAFPELRELNVACCPQTVQDSVVEAAHVDGHPRTLHFPRLRVLRIQSSVGIGALLECAKLPAHMDEIRIDAKPNVLRLLSGATLPAARRVAVRVKGNQSCDSEMLTVVCGLLASARGSSAVELAIDNEYSYVSADSITCTTLTQLHLAGPVSVDTMFALIRKLPRLTDLALFQLEANEVGPALLQLPAPGDEWVAPLATKIRRCELMFEYLNPLSETAIRLVQYLMLRIPTLTDFTAMQVPRQTVVEFVGAFARQYPHLPAIKLTLAVDWGGESFS
ncbi:hypothetical protein IWQ57_001933, partial [Coemansia nantahalensis]